MQTNLLNVPHIPQGDNHYCLAACTAMVLAYWERPTTIKKLVKLLGSSRYGTPSSRIMRLSQWRVDVSHHSATHDDLLTYLDDGIPLIIMLKTGFLDYFDDDVHHTVVLVGLDETYAYLNDPAFDNAPKQAFIDGFLAAWVEKNQVVGVIRPQR